MARFFFDVDDGHVQSRDGEGLELADAAEARKAGIAILPDIAREELPNGDRRVFICQVRDESGTVIFIATLSLVAEWVGHSSPPQ